MSYKSQHARLLALMAQAFAIHSGSKSCAAVYNDTITHQRNGDTTQIPYNHANTAGLEAYVTQISLDGAEDARRCCGGHDYSLLSCLPTIFSAVLPLITLEGKTYVLYQQIAGFLIKRVMDIHASKHISFEMALLIEGHLRSTTSPCSA